MPETRPALVQVTALSCVRPLVTIWTNDDAFNVGNRGEFQLKFWTLEFHPGFPFHSVKCVYKRFSKLPLVSLGLNKTLVMMICFVAIYQTCFLPCVTKHYVRFRQTWLLLLIYAVGVCIMAAQCNSITHCTWWWCPINWEREACLLNATTKPIYQMYRHHYRSDHVIRRIIIMTIFVIYTIIWRQEA